MSKLRGIQITFIYLNYEAVSFIMNFRNNYTFIFTFGKWRRIRSRNYISITILGINFCEL